ncbi:MAG: DUF1049 domain-containing protein [Deltaproteobacteria bacterium]|nr:DUF1049 domain-containing protein [Deltaproteobacteria bacterium]
MKHIKFIIAIIVMMLVIIVIVENHEAFSTKVIFKLELFSINLQTREISLYYIVAVTFLLGILIAGFYGMFERFNLKKQIKTLINSSREKDKELNSLRNLPITSDVSSSHFNGTERDI